MEAKIPCTDGPLLQRSTSVVSENISDSPVLLDVVMAPEIPRYYTGAWYYPAETGSTLASLGVQDGAFNRTRPTVHGTTPNNAEVGAYGWFQVSVAGLWYDDAPLQDVVRGCRDVCTAKLAAPALAAVACSNQLIAVNYTRGPAAPYSRYGARPLYQYAYIVGADLNVNGSHESIDLITAHATISDYEQCTGTLNLSVCSLRSAIGEYDIVSSRVLASLLRQRNQFG